MEDEVRAVREGSSRPSTPRTLGRYRVVAELGRGSTSIVYLGARGGAGGFNKLVALKQLRPALAADAAQRALFVAEARLGARLSHPNVVQTLEIEEGDAQPVIVMEYLDGQPLHQVIGCSRAAFTPMPLYMHLAALTGTLEGLAYAHDATGDDGAPLRVVHRDVNPHNVFVTASGQPKLLDFGLAQTIETTGATHASAGRAAYMSPEQAAGGVVDVRSDLFGIGVMLWEATTRKRFWGDAMTRDEIVRALVARALPASRVTALAGAPSGLQALIAKATAPDPADRYANASALQLDLQAAVHAITPATFDLRDLGRKVTLVFATERARLQAAIEADLATAAQALPEGAPASTPAPPSVRRPLDEIPPPPSLRAETAPPVSASSAPLPRFPYSRREKAGQWLMRSRQVVLAAAIAGVLGAVGAIAWRGEHEAGPQGAAAAAAASMTQAGSTPELALAKTADVATEGAPTAAGGRESVHEHEHAVVLERENDHAVVHEHEYEHAATPTPAPEPAPTLAHAPAPAPAPALLSKPVRVGSALPLGPPPARPSRPIDAVNPYAP